MVCKAKLCVLLVQGLPSSLKGLSSGVPKWMEQYKDVLFPLWLSLPAH